MRMDRVWMEATDEELAAQQEVAAQQNKRGVTHG